MSQLNSYSPSQQLAAVALTGDELKQLVITFDAWDSYSISAPETVSVSLPASVLSSNQPLVIGSFVVLADVGAATLTGSLLGTPYEKTLQSAPLSDMVLSLTNDTWVDGLQNKDGVLQQIFDGIVGNTPCLGQGPGSSGDACTPPLSGWNKVIQKALDVNDVEVLSPTELIIGVRRRSNYEIGAPETVSVTLPAAALLSGRTTRAAPPLVVKANKGSFTMTLQHAVTDGVSRLPSIPETVLNEQTTRLTLRLAGDAWDDDTNRTMRADFDNEGNLYPSAWPRTKNWQDLVERIYCDTQTRFGWTSGATQAYLPMSFTRTNERTLVLDMPTFPAFSIDVPETITVSLPGSVTRSRQEYLAVGSFIIHAHHSSVTVEGDRIDESMMRSYGPSGQSYKDVTFRLNYGEGRLWNPGIGGVKNEGRNALLTSQFESAQNEPLGWNAIVRPVLQDIGRREIHSSQSYIKLKRDIEDGVADGQRLSLSLQLGQFENYNITAPETISVRLTGPPVLQTAAVPTTFYFIIRATRGAAALSGAMEEAVIKKGGSHTLHVALDDAEWDMRGFSPLALGTTQLIPDGRQQLIASLTSDQSELNGFNNVLQPAIVAADFVLTGRTAVAITVPPVPLYEITTPETLRLHIPAGAISTLLNSPVVGSVIVNASAGTASVAGGLVDAGSEASIRSSLATLDVRLKDDSWTPETLLREWGGDEYLLPDAALEFSSDAAEGNGWNAMMSSRLSGGLGMRAELLSASVLRVHFPRVPGYDITSPETISLTIPGAAVLSRQPISVSPAFVVSAVGGTARLGGTMVLAASLGRFINVSDFVQIRLEIPTARAGQLASHCSHISSPVLPEEYYFFCTPYTANPICCPQPRWHPSIGSPGDASTVVLAALREHIPFLTNATLMGVGPNDGGLEYGGDVMGLDSSWQPNATHLTYVDNSTILATIAVPREFAVPERDDHPFEITSPLSFSAFADNASLPINLKVTATASILYHLEEVPTGITRRFADEDGLRTAPPAELSGDGSGWVNEPDTAEAVGWFPNLVAQTQRQVEAQALDAAPTHTLEIHLENDAWVDAVGADYDVGSGGPTALLLAALVSSSNETSGWNAIVQQNLHQANNIRLARISDTAVVVQLPASDAYAIERPETIDVTVPAAAVRSNAEIRVSPQVATPAWARWAAYDVHPIIITPIVGSVSVATDFGNETDLNMLEEGVTHQLTLSLDGDAWVDTVGDAGSDLNVAIVRGLTSSSDEVSGWNRVVQNALAFLAATQSIVTRVSALDVRVDVPFISGYDITRADVVSVTVPAAALATNMTTTGASFAVMPSPSACTLEFGGVAETPNAAGLRTSSLVLRLA